MALRRGRGYLEVQACLQQNVNLTGKRIVKAGNGKFTIAGTRRINGNSEILLQFVSSGFVVEELVSFGASGTQTGKDIELSREGGFFVLGTNSYGESSMISLMKTSITGDL